MKTPEHKDKEPPPDILDLDTPQIPGEQIRERAYQIYRARGGAAGMHLSDWLQAEVELTRALRFQNAGSTAQTAYQR
jgi:hypothetical protein